MGSNSPIHLGRDIYVNASLYAGQTLIHIRVYLKSSDGELVPQKKGITLKLDEFKQLTNALPTIKDNIKQIESTTDNPTTSKKEEPSSKKRK